MTAMFRGVHALHQRQRTAVLKVTLFGTAAHQVRDPALMAAVQRAPASLVSKTTDGYRRVQGWLGDTVFSADGADTHSALRELLAPAFSPAATRALVPAFEEVGDELAEAMVALGGGGGGWPGGGSGGSGGGNGAEKAGGGGAAGGDARGADVEQLCRRATMDALGRAAFGYDFGAVAAAMPQAAAAAAAAPEAGGGGGGGNSAAPSSASPSSAPSSAPSAHVNGSSSSGPQAPAPPPPDMRDILEVWDRLLTTALLLAFNLPVPDALVPGWRQYLRSVSRLNEIVDAVLSQRAAEDATLERGGEARAAPAEASLQEDGAPPPADLLTALLKAQRERPDLVSRQSVRDHIHLFMFAGSDTTASLLAFLFYELSRRPLALARCAREARAAVAEAREQGARPPSRQDRRAPGYLHPYAPARLPYLSACLSETLRLNPPGTDTARKAAADLELGGFFVPKGSLLLLNNYALHRHEDHWPRAEEWLPERWLSSGAAAELAAAEAAAVAGAAGAGGGATGGGTPVGDDNPRPLLCRDQLLARDPEAYAPFGVGARACVGRYFALLEGTVLACRALSVVDLAPGGEEVVLLQKFTLASERGVFVRTRRAGRACE